MSDLEEILVSLYVSAISVSISWIWDGDIDVKLGDPLSGYKAEGKWALSPKLPIGSGTRPSDIIQAASSPGSSRRAEPCHSACGVQVPRAFPLPVWRLCTDRRNDGDLTWIDLATSGPCFHYPTRRFTLAVLNAPFATDSGHSRHHYRTAGVVESSEGISTPGAPRGAASFPLPGSAKVRSRRRLRR